MRVNVIRNYHYMVFFLNFKKTNLLMRIVRFCLVRKCVKHILKVCWTFKLMIMETMIDGKKYKLVEIKEQPINTALFIITMTSVNTWSGHWSGEKTIYAKSILAFRRKKPIYENLKEGNYGYTFNGGWRTNIEVKFVTKKDANFIMKNSKGFMGYEWMIYDICKYGEIKQK